jgi:hypothetical protein
MCCSKGLITSIRRPRRGCCRRSPRRNWTSCTRSTLAGVESRERYVQGEATVPLRLVNALIESLEPAIHYEGVLLTLSLRDRQAVRKAIADVRATISNGG